jgi:hypothetical protein
MRAAGAALVRSVLLAACVLGFAARAEAQVGSDSLLRAQPADTLGPTSAAAVRSESAPVEAPGAAPTSSAASSASRDAAPADTTLKKVCSGVAPGSLAPGLLVVVFSAGTTREAAQAAVKTIGGTIAGMSDKGEVYVQVPPSAGPLPTVADQLIRQDPVSQVAPAPCPAAAPPATSRTTAADTAAAGGAASGSAKSTDSTARPAPSP